MFFLNYKEGWLTIGVSLVAQWLRIRLQWRRCRKTCVQSLGREDPPGGGNGNSLQYSCLDNPMDRRAWRAIAHRITISQTWLIIGEKTSILLHLHSLLFPTTHPSTKCSVNASQQWMCVTCQVKGKVLPSWSFLPSPPPTPDPRHF